jgi:hypothetical protein
MNVETVLVILLSVGFIILLVLSATLLIILIKISRSLQRMTARAEVATENLSEAMRGLAKRLAPGMLAGLAGVAMRKMRGRKPRSDE